MFRQVSVEAMARVVLPVALALCGCGDSSGSGGATEVPVPVAPATDAPAEAASGSPAPPANTAAVPRTFGRVRLEIPAGWQENPLSGIRATILDASYSLPAVDERIEVTFSTIGGGVRQNLDRWVGQFQQSGTQPLRRTIDVDGTDATWLEVSGTFTARAAGNPGPHSDWMLLGAAVPLGDRDFYLKLTGPASAVRELRDEILALIKSARLD